MTSSSWMTQIIAFYLTITGKKKRTKQSKKDKQRGTLALLFIIGTIIIALGILIFS